MPLIYLGLNKGLPQLGIGKSSKHKKTLNQLQGKMLLMWIFGGFTHIALGPK